MSISTRKKIIFADALRGVAALCVVASHYLGTFWTIGAGLTLVANVPPIPNGLTLPATALIMSGYFDPAEFGVALFFLISGFVIPLSLDRLGRAAFLWARLWRIVPTYAVGFLGATIVALLAASAVFHRQFPYTLSEVALHTIPGVRWIFQSRFIDYVIWTLEIEVSFYLLCAIIAPWLRRGSPRVLLVLMALAVAAMVSRDDYSIYPTSLIFMFAGVAVNFHQTRKASIATALLIGCIAFFVTLAILFVKHGNFWSITGYMWAVALFVSSYVIKDHFPNILLLRALSAISYPLYVVHGILGYVLMRILVAQSFPPMAAVIVTFCFATMISVALHFSVEIPTQRIGGNAASIRGWLPNRTPRRPTHRSCRIRPRP